MIIAHERSSIYENLLIRTSSLVLFAVPHRGSDIAYWGNFATHLANYIQLNTGTNTEWVKILQKKHQTFADISVQFIERAATLKIRTFYETEKYFGQLVVDKESARLNIPNETPAPINANHKHICKFDGLDSRIYRPVWKALQVLCEPSRIDFSMSDVS